MDHQPVGWTLSQRELGHAETGRQRVERRHRGRAHARLRQCPDDTLGDLGERQVSNAVIGYQVHEHVTVRVSSRPVCLKCRAPSPWRLRSGR